MKKYLWIVLFLILQDSLFAHHLWQRRGGPGLGYSVSGRILESTTGDALPMAPIMVKDMGIFTVADMDGRFIFYALPVGEHVLVVQHLGFQTIEKKISVTDVIEGLVFEMLPSSLSLETVEVVARVGTDMGSSSFINRQALEHVQPQSLQDVMRLVPGFVGGGSSLMNQQLMTIRSVTGNAEANAANAFGTAIIMDGISIHNDASMQGTAGLSTSEASATQRGVVMNVDVRQISVENIESVEIIRGVPSVEFANMTSGAVVIRTRIGVSPYEVRFRTDPQSTMLSASRGFRVGQERGGILNISADYTRAIQNLLLPEGAFNRFNLNTAFRTTIARELTMNVRLSGNYTLRSQDLDPGFDHIDSWQRNQNRSLRLSVDGTWTPRNPLNIVFNYTFSGSIAEQNFHSRRLNTSSTRIPFATARETGVFEGAWVDKINFYEDDIRHGLPIDFQARLVARSHLIFDNGVNNRAILGFELSTSGNRGRGLEQRPFPIARELNIRDIPFFTRTSLFAENRISFPMPLQTRLDIQAGARANFILPNEAFLGYQLRSLGPSFNVRYQILDRATGFRELAVRGGWGMSFRTPTLASLFPQPIFNDRVLFSYNDLANVNNPHALAVFETHRVIPEIGHDLRMPRTINTEFALDFVINRIVGNIAFFNERMSRSFESINVHTPHFGGTFLSRDGRIFIEGDASPIQDRTGLNFRFNNGIIEHRVEMPTWYFYAPLHLFPDSTFHRNSAVTNGIMINKWGFEMTLNLGQIPRLNTSVQIDALYSNEARTSSNEIGVMNSQGGIRPDFQPIPGNMHLFTVQYFLGSGSNVANVNVRERLSSNVRLVTHIPRVGIVTTLTAQVVIFEGNRNRSDVNGRNMIYFFDSDSVRHSGDIVFRDETYLKHINPLRFRDIHGNLHEWEDWMETDPNFRHMRLSTSSATILRPTRHSPYMMLDLRVSKDIGRHATISLFAENFLHLLGLSQSDITRAWVVNNPRPRFGAEIRMRF